MHLLLVALLLPSGLPGQETPRSQVPPGSSFPAQVEGVVVDAVVLDRRGNPVGGLTAEDFLVEEDGGPQTITSFEAVAIPESRETAVAQDIAGLHQPRAVAAPTFPDVRHRVRQRPHGPGPDRIARVGP